MLQTDIEVANRLFHEAVQGLVNIAIGELPQIKPPPFEHVTIWEMDRLNAAPIARIERAMDAIMEVCNPYSNRDDPRAALYHHLLFKKLEAKGIVSER